MNKFLRYSCLGLVVMLSACAPDIETLDLISVPDIPDEMLHESKEIQQELANDKAKILEEIKKQERN